MTITTTYDESTNTIILTGGTKDTPAILDDFLNHRVETDEPTPEDNIFNQRL